MPDSLHRVRNGVQSVLSAPISHHLTHEVTVSDADVSHVCLARASVLDWISRCSVTNDAPEATRTQCNA